MRSGADTLGFARKLERARVPYADCWAMLLRAGAAARAAKSADAVAILRRGVARCDAEGMLSCAAAARRRLGELIGGTEGTALIIQADAWYASEGVKNPERFTDMLAPGFRLRRS
jgi:hypothetical protein